MRYKEILMQLIVTAYRRGARQLRKVSGLSGLIPHVRDHEAKQEVWQETCTLVAVHLFYSLNDAAYL